MLLVNPGIARDERQERVGRNAAADACGIDKITGEREAKVGLVGCFAHGIADTIAGFALVDTAGQGLSARRLGVAQALHAVRPIYTVRGRDRQIVGR